MGQSVLRDWPTPFRGRAFAQARARHRRKGIGLTFPNPDAEIGRRSFARASFGRGNAGELGDGGVGPGKSSLFFVRAGGLPGMGLYRDRDVAPAEHRSSGGVRSADVAP